MNVFEGVPERRPIPLSSLFVEHSLQFDVTMQQRSGVGAPTGPRGPHVIQVRATLPVETEMREDCTFLVLSTDCLLRKLPDTIDPVSIQCWDALQRTLKKRHLHQPSHYSVHPCPQKENIYIWISYYYLNFRVYGCRGWLFVMPPSSRHMSSLCNASRGCGYCNIVIIFVIPTCN